MSNERTVLVVKLKSGVSASLTDHDAGSLAQLLYKILLPFATFK